MRKKPVYSRAAVESGDTQQIRNMCEGCRIFPRSAVKRRKQKPKFRISMCACMCALSISLCMLRCHWQGEVTTAQVDTYTMYANVHKKAPEYMYPLYEV